MIRFEKRKGEKKMLKQNIQSGIFWLLGGIIFVGAFVVKSLLNGSCIKPEFIRDKVLAAISFLNGSQKEMAKRKKELLRTEKKLWELKSARTYEKVFERAAMPIQTLLGLANYPTDTFSKEKMDYYLWDVITNPLADAVKKSNGKIENGILELPVQGNFREEEVKQKIEKLSAQELDRYVRENNHKISGGEIAFKKREVVRELGSILNELESFRQAEKLQEDDIGRLAEKVQGILVKNEIYPMFSNDNRLRPELKKRFSQANKYTMPYPGLFIKSNGVWDVLGAYIGMDDCEV